MSQEEFPSSPLKPIDELVTASGAIPVLTESAFEAVLKLERAVLYLMVNWSGPEQFSRICVFKAWPEMDGKEVPLYWIDHSKGDKPYLTAWLTREKAREPLQVAMGGWGETLWLVQGRLVDAIPIPHVLGLEKTKAVLQGWIDGATRKDVP